MRATVWTAAAAASLLLAPEFARGVLAVAAATLIEAVPLFALALTTPRSGPWRCLAWLLSCGCGFGPSARSLPATAAAWLAFGPAVALARLAAAHAVARWVPGTNASGFPACRSTSPVLEGLRLLLPAAFAAGTAAQLVALAPPATLAAPAQLIAGALFGFFAAPCGLGAIAVAVALRVRAPLAAGAFLCVAGIADARAFARAHGIDVAPDPLAYLLLSAALGFVAWRHGAGLVHPMLAYVAAVGALATFLAAVVHRRRCDGSARWAPAFALAGALIAVPPPQYRATETTASDLFAGQRLRFSGVLSRDGAHAALVRYAITCCRADAAPVAVRLSATPRFSTGTWLRAEGVVESRHGALQLHASAIRAAAPPADPFLYR